jgi:hypothetical protein
MCYATIHRSTLKLADGTLPSTADSTTEKKKKKNVKVSLNNIALFPSMIEISTVTRLSKDLTIKL